MVIDKIDKTNEEIATLVQNGNTAMFGVLVERFESKLIRYSRKFLFDYTDAEDLVQEIFIKAFVNIRSFDISRAFSPWLYRIAHNEFINAIKKKGREPISFFDPDTLFPHPVDPNFADTEIKENELKEMMDKCLNKLDLKYREILILYFYEEMNYQEMAEILHIPVSTVGIRLMRGKTTIKNIYSKLYPGS